MNPEHNPDRRRPEEEPPTNGGSWPVEPSSYAPAPSFVSMKPGNDGQRAERPKIATSEAEIAALNLDYDDPYRLALLAVVQHHTHSDVLTVRHYRQEWYFWKGQLWQVISDDEFEAKLREFIQEEMIRTHKKASQAWNKEGKQPRAIKVSESLIRGTARAIKSLCILSDAIHPPGWLEGNKLEPRNYIAVSNGLIDIDATMKTEKTQMQPHTPRWFSSVCLPYAFDYYAACPKWEAFLRRNLMGDAQLIAILQEWFGYCLLPDTSLQKFLMLLGEGSNGKSVICGALEGVLGSENCSHVPLEMFEDRFALGQTHGKLANIVSEIGDVDKTAEGKLKGFVDGAPQHFDRKYKSSYTLAPTARLTFATNGMPRWKDRSDAIYRRMIAILMRFKISEDDTSRVPGMDKAEWWLEQGELSGMLCWAMLGLKRLRTQGKFTTSDSSQAASEEYRNDNNTARAFLQEHCVEDATAETSKMDLYKHYKDWCENNGNAALNNVNFSKEVMKMFDKTTTVSRRVGESRLRYYVGIKYEG